MMDKERFGFEFGAYAFFCSGYETDYGAYNALVRFLSYLLLFKDLAEFYVNFFLVKYRELGISMGHDIYS